MRDEGNISRGNGVVCVEILENIKFNTALLGTNGYLSHTLNLDSLSLQIIQNNKEKFEEIARRVGRMHSRNISGKSGVTFAVAPGLLMTCKHSSVFEFNHIRAISTGIQSFFSVDIINPVDIKQIPIDTDYLNKLAVLDRDPMSEQHKDFMDFDIALFSLPSPPWQKKFPTDWSPLFPDVVIPLQESQVAVVHYPGDPDGPTSYTIFHPTEPRKTKIEPIGNYLGVFKVLGQKTISLGKRLTATNHPGDNILAYDTNTLDGSSGAPIIRVDAPANTFCGIHIGGEYFQDERWPKGWNHGYSVSNPHFVLLYVRYVVPYWKEIQKEIPEEVRLFVRANHSIIHAHRNWLCDMTDWLLSL